MQDNIQKLKDFINGNSKLKKRIKFYNPSSGERIGVVIGNQPFRLSPGNLFTIFNNANNDTERDEVIVEWLNNSFLPLFKNSYPENGEKLCEALDALNESVFGDKGKDGFSKLVEEDKQSIKKTQNKNKEAEQKENKKVENFINFLETDEKLNKYVTCNRYFYDQSKGTKISMSIGEKTKPTYIIPFNCFYDKFNNANNDTERVEVIVECLNDSFCKLLQHSQLEDEEIERIREALDPLNESVFGDKGKDGFSKEIIYRQQLKKKIRETRSQIKEDQKVINKKLRRNKKFKDVREQSEIFDKRTKQVIKVAESSLKEFITKANAATQEEKDIYAVLVEQRIQLEKQLFLSLEDNNEKEKKKIENEIEQNIEKRNQLRKKNGLSDIKRRKRRKSKKIEENKVKNPKPNFKKSQKDERFLKDVKNASLDVDSCCKKMEKAR